MAKRKTAKKVVKKTEKLTTKVKVKDMPKLESTNPVDSLVADCKKSEKGKRVRNNESGSVRVTLVVTGSAEDFESYAEEHCGNFKFVNDLRMIYGYPKNSVEVVYINDFYNNPVYKTPDGRRRLKEIELAEN
jgi:hypothetical protein